MPTAGELYRLARLLRELALAVTSDPDEPTVSLALVTITDDIAQHPRTTVGEVVARTGLAQSLVSRTVVQLREAGIVAAATDEADRRRTLITITAAARSGVFASRAERGITDAMSGHFPGASPQRLVSIERQIDRLIAELGKAERQR